MPRQRTANRIYASGVVPDGGLEVAGGCEPPPEERCRNCGWFQPYPASGEDSDEFHRLRASCDGLCCSDPEWRFGVNRNGRNCGGFTDEPHAWVDRWAWYQEVMCKEEAARKKLPKRAFAVPMQVSLNFRAIVRARGRDEAARKVYAWIESGDRTVENPLRAYVAKLLTFWSVQDPEEVNVRQLAGDEEVLK